MNPKNPPELVRIKDDDGNIYLVLVADDEADASENA